MASVLRSSPAKSVQLIDAPPSPCTNSAGSASSAAGVLRTKICWPATSTVSPGHIAMSSIDGSSASDKRAVGAVRFGVLTMGSTLRERPSGRLPGGRLLGRRLLGRSLLGRRLRGRLLGRRLLGGGLRGGLLRGGVLRRGLLGGRLLRRSRGRGVLVLDARRGRPARGLRRGGSPSLLGRLDRRLQRRHQVDD